VCGTVQEVGEELVADISRRARRELGFEIEDARLDFYGVCRDCLAAGAGPGTSEVVGEVVAVSR
jgi:Fe2+ or Zn2+ uptake regulation protein